MELSDNEKELNQSLYLYSNELLNENDSLNLCHDIEELNQQLDNINLNESVFIKKVEQWRKQAHDLIDQYCQMKCENFLEKMKEQINESKEKLKSLSIDHDDASHDYIQWFNNTIKLINKQIYEIDHIKVKISPLTVDNSFINYSYKNYLEDHSAYLFKDLFSSLSLSSFNELTTKSRKNSLEKSFILFDENEKQSIKLFGDNWYSLSMNNNYLLIPSRTNLYLFNKSFEIVKKKTYCHFEIKDICWSETLFKFILITSKNIYTIDENLTSNQICSINSISDFPWERGTCSQSFLFLSTYGENFCIYQYNFLPSINLNKKIQSLEICQKNEIINDMKSNQFSIGFIIENNLNNETHLDIRLIDSFQLISSIQLGRGWAYRCSPFNRNQWIIVDPYNYRFIYISNDKIIHQIDYYPIKPLNIIQFNQNQFIIRTNQHIFIHNYELTHLN